MAEIKIKLPGSLIFGNKEILRLGSEVSAWGDRVLLISDSVHNQTGTLDHVKEILEKKRLKVLIYNEVHPSASTFSIDEAVSLARGSHCQVVVGLGGGRTLSFAKAVAFTASGEGNIDDFYTDRVKREKILPLILVPTSIRDPFLLTESCFITESRQRTSSICHLPSGSTKQIIIDPSLTVTLPAKYTLLVLMEIMLSSIEAFISPFSSFLVETAALDAIHKVSVNLDAITANQGDLNLRRIACEAAVNSAIALSLTGPLPGLMLSYSTASYYKIPEVSVSSILYPYIFDSPIYSSSEKLREVYRLLSDKIDLGTPDGTENLSSIIRSLLSKLRLPVRLRDLNVSGDELSICSDITASIIGKNQNTAGSDSLFEILREAY